MADEEKTQDAQDPKDPDPKESKKSESPDLAGIVEAGFQALTDSEKDTATANEVRELAARLSEGEQRVALAEHLAAFRTEDGKDQRLERLLAEVDVLGPASAPQFAARADAAYAESSPKRREKALWLASSRR